MTGPIVLEGPDCSGKTTLAKQLCERLGWTYAHQGPPPRVKDLTGYYISLLAPSTVIDRLAMSEVIYGPILRDKSRINPMGWVRFQRALRVQGGKQVICLPPIETCLEGWRANLDNELVKTEGDFRAIYAVFAHYAGAWAIPTYDWTMDSLDTLVKRLEK